MINIIHDINTNVCGNKNNNESNNNKNNYK